MFDRDRASCSAGRLARDQGHCFREGATLSGSDHEMPTGNIGGMACGLNERRGHVVDEGVIAQLCTVAVYRQLLALRGEPDHLVEDAAIGGAGPRARAINVREPQGDAAHELRARCDFEGAFGLQLVRVVNGNRLILRRSSSVSVNGMPHCVTVPARTRVGGLLLRPIASSIRVSPVTFAS